MENIEKLLEITHPHVHGYCLMYEIILALNLSFLVSNLILEQTQGFVDCE